MTISVIGLVLALAVIIGYPKNESIQRLLTTAFLIVGIAGSIMIGLAAHEGGKIMRPELWQF